MACSNVNFLILAATVFLLFFLAAAAEATTNSSTNQFGPSPGFGGAGMCTFVITRGYPCQEHTVTTSDGYILSLQRIGNQPSKPPVLLQHGLFANAACWMAMPQQSLAFVLVDNGYDVWTANTRGTAYSRGHTTLSPYTTAYWDWSWSELSANDLSANVKYIHDLTGQNLHYVGHSLGTLISLAALSQNQETDMLKSAALLAPIAYLSRMPTPTATAGSQSSMTQQHKGEFDPRSDVDQELMSRNMLTALMGSNCCLRPSAISGPEPQQLSPISGLEPQPSSPKNLIHLSQVATSGVIAKYNYGPMTNMQRYGSATPPVYDMSAIPKDFPLYLSYGGRDTLSDVVDVRKLLGKLQDHQPDKLVAQFLPTYGHMDFILGMSAKALIYDPIMAFFQQQK